MVQRMLERIFLAGAAVNVWLTRSRYLRWIETRVLTPFNVRLTFWIRGKRAVAPNAEALGGEWERLMPSRDWMQITRVEGDTAYGTINVRCTLRGTGDVDACYRMMAYDRRLMARNGGQLVVLHSQAEPGRTTCEVAIRPFDVAVDDLVPAHLRLRRVQ
jgi:hypothetical protein